MGPYGTALIQGQSYTNAVAVGSGTGKFSNGNINMACLFISTSY